MRKKEKNTSSLSLISASGPPFGGSGAVAAAARTWACAYDADARARVCVSVGCRGWKRRKGGAVKQRKQRQVQERLGGGRDLT